MSSGLDKEVRNEILKRLQSERTVLLEVLNDFLSQSIRLNDKVIEIYDRLDDIHKAEKELSQEGEED